MEQIEISREPGTTANTTIIRLKGPLTLSTLFPLQDLLRELPACNTVMDVTDVPYIDSAGMGTILSHWTHTEGAGNKFAMSGTSQRIEVLLEVTQVHKILKRFKTAAEADASFAGK